MVRVPTRREGFGSSIRPNLVDTCGESLEFGIGLGFSLRITDGFQTSLMDFKALGVVYIETVLQITLFPSIVGLYSRRLDTPVDKVGWEGRTTGERIRIHQTFLSSWE